MIKKILVFIFAFSQFSLFGQELPSYVQSFKLRVDTSEFSWQEDRIEHAQQWQLPFQFSENNTTVQITTELKTGFNDLHLKPSGDFQLLDTITVNNGRAQFRLAFNNLAKSQFLKLQFKADSSGVPRSFALPLLPYTQTTVQLRPTSMELYLNEEAVIELNTNRPENVVVDNLWKQSGSVDYRLKREGNRLLLHLLPREPGRQTVQIPIALHQPELQDGRMVYQLDTLQPTFTVKTGRLAFLDIDKEEITLFEGSTRAVEVQVSDHRLLKMNHTYRIENQEEPGGALVAELYTKSKLNNDKVLCLLRPYAYHRKTEGYLYIKDGDDARFITNFNISPKTQINKIFIQREGKDWVQSQKVYPGETINLRFEGQGLHKGDFNFYGAPLLVGDSLVRNEDVAYFRIRVPLDITNREIEIFNNNKSTGKSLQVSEYQRPRNFDFIDIGLGLKRYQLNQIDQPIYYEKTLQDVVIFFDEKKIDRPQNLYGKQFLSIKVKVSNKNGNLVELYEFEDLVVCPGENSARFKYYNKSNCQLEDINLNNFITRKTHSLEEWSRIELIFSHQNEKYGGEGMKKRIQIVLARDINFDIDVSFPAGLLILKSGENDFSNFGGISFAMIAQMSFYHPDKIAEYRPWKIGAGFIALDAFNFSDNSSNRDVGLVLIGSLYPTSSENKLSFPLYAGYGYLLKQRKGFFLIGPGIRVRL